MMKLRHVLPFCASALAACSSSSVPDVTGASPCVAQFGGSTADAVTLPANCAHVELFASSDVRKGGYTLTMQSSSPRIASLAIEIDLGGPPSPGTFTPETVVAWSVKGGAAGDAGCGYGAGSGAVPSGTFTLELTSIDGSVAPAIAHGTLHISLYVHASPGASCGPGDTEEATFAF